MAAAHDPTNEPPSTLASLFSLPKAGSRRLSEPRPDQALSSPPQPAAAAAAATGDVPTPPLPPHVAQAVGIFLLAFFVIWALALLLECVVGHGK